VRDRIEPYFDTLLGVIREAQCSDRQGAALPLHEAFERLREAARSAHAAGNTITFIGNGGSAAIASHLAVDFSKNGGMRARALNDGAALTCLGNDFGYEHVFAKQIEWHARAGDVVVAISSSGGSANILNAVEAARGRDCTVATFSGFREDNELRRAGDVNFYVRSDQYGFVEVAHLALCHAILDLDMGWTGGR
jgi:D-sedoheptulose 7-phosphate isomerase